MNTSWRDDLHEENSLWDTFKKSPGLIGKNFNTLILSITALTLAAILITDQFTRVLISYPILSAATLWRDITTIGFGFGTTILAFILAGFTVFSSITKPELFIAMAKTTHDESELSHLKYLFFSFMNVFIHYLAFTAFCLACIIFGDHDGPLDRIVDVLIDDQFIKRLLASFAFYITAIWFCVILIKLKSFIWNVYSAVLLSISFG
jgi:hypothetical protein